MSTVRHGAPRCAKGSPRRGHVDGVNDGARCAVITTWLYLGAAAHREMGGFGLGQKQVFWASVRRVPGKETAQRQARRRGNVERCKK